MSIVASSGRSLDELVDYVLDCMKRRDARTVIIQHLSENFGLTKTEADLVLDRVCSSVARAATGGTDNSPAKKRTR